VTILQGTRSTVQEAVHHRVGGVRLSPSTARVLGTLCMVAGFVSIAASIGIWFLSKSDDPAHAERFGIFVGLWAPTFFVLATWFQRPALSLGGATGLTVG
jgi:hypothetical protein